MPQGYQLRRQAFDDDRNLGEHSRDVREALDTIPRFIYRTFERYYAEPMIIGNLTEEPLTIVLERVVNLNAAETPVLCGSMVHYVWKPQLGGARVTSIDGLTPSTSVKYRFVFRLSFAPAVGV